MGIGTNYNNSSDIKYYLQCKKYYCNDFNSNPNYNIMDNIFNNIYR